MPRIETRPPTGPARWGAGRARALDLRIVALAGTHVERRLLLVMRRRSGLSGAAAGFLEMACARDAGEPKA